MIVIAGADLEGSRKATSASDKSTTTWMSRLTNQAGVSPSNGVSSSPVYSCHQRLICDSSPPYVSASSGSIVNRLQGNSSPASEGVQGDWLPIRIP